MTTVCFKIEVLIFGMRILSTWYFLFDCSSEGIKVPAFAGMTITSAERLGYLVLSVARLKIMQEMLRCTQHDSFGVINSVFSVPPWLD
ncbi:hypothetical protein DBR40_14710 [Pedobacter sp. KBW01]|nr:hypothetical protein DBR40_14710 [Pedobacter sp. KBW01]